MINNFENKFQSKIHVEMNDLRKLDGYKNNPAIDNSVKNLQSNKYWICGVIHGMRTAFAIYKILKKGK